MGLCIVGTILCLHMFDKGPCYLGVTVTLLVGHVTCHAHVATLNIDTILNYLCISRDRSAVQMRQEDNVYSEI